MQVLFATFVLSYFVLVAVYNYDDIDLFEFIKTFLLCVCFFMVFFHSLVKDVTRSLFSLKKTSGVLIVFISLFMMIQLLEQLFYNSHSSWFMFDQISTSTAVDPIRFKSSIFQSYIRPTSVYYEPSYLGFVLFLLMVVNIELRGRLIYSVIAVLAILLTVSSVSYIFLFLFLFVRFFSTGCKECIVLVIFSLVFVLFDGFRFLRLEELTWVGTSGYQRITEPLLATISYLSAHPFGLPLGQASFLYNNSFFVVALYFGILFPFVMFLYGYCVYKRTYSIRMFISYFVVVFFLLNLNGSIFTPDGAFFIAVINYIYLVVSHGEIEK